jgi:hypothetical protein
MELSGHPTSAKLVTVIGEAVLSHMSPHDAEANKTGDQPKIVTFSPDNAAPAIERFDGHVQIYLRSATQLGPLSNASLKPCNLSH